MIDIGAEEASKEFFYDVAPLIRDAKNDCPEWFLIRAKEEVAVVEIECNDCALMRTRVRNDVDVRVTEKSDVRDVNRVETKFRSQKHRNLRRKVGVEQKASHYDASARASLWLMWDSA
jgi:hypothetical protein